MIVKRYWSEPYEGILCNHIEVEEFEDYEGCLKYIFQHKLAGDCSGYEIMDLTEQEYYEIKADPKQWEHVQNSIIERWYDKAAMSKRTIGGNTIRNNYGIAF